MKIIKNDDFIYQYFFASILVTVFLEAGEFALRFHENKWNESIKKENEYIQSPDPLDFKIDELVGYLRSICHNVHNVTDMGDISGITSFQIYDEIIFGMFWFGGNADDRWVVLRLLYGEAAPIAAKKAIDSYQAHRIFG